MNSTIARNPNPLFISVAVMTGITFSSLSDADSEELNDAPPLALETITVEAAKVPTAQEDIAASITVIDRDRLERELVQTISDMVRYEPGIDVVDQGSRFGRAGFSIRGLGGNRVLVEVDGVPVADAFSIGDFSNASRDFVEVDSLKQVEIIRGPSSALFGSDAVGGVVSFVTRDPEDYLETSNHALRASVGGFSLDDSLAGSVTGAGRSGDFSALLTATYREGHERNDTGADPLDFDSLNLLGKLVWGEVGTGGLKATVERFQENSTTDVQSLVGEQDFTPGFGFPFIITIKDVTANDEQERTRLGLEQSWNDGFAFMDYFRWRGYWQDSSTHQVTFEERETFVIDSSTPVERERLFEFEQQLAGLELNAASDFETGAIRHQLAYGLELERAETSQIRDGSQLDLLTGEISNQVGPDRFPVRDFPASETDALGIYLQDTFTIGNVSLIPALRWDRFELTPEADDIFLEDNPGIEPVELSESELSPKFGVLWDITGSWQLYGQYSEGFRAPPVNNVNVGFTNFQFGYTAIPNPDLQSESSSGVELGLRYFSDRSQWELSVYESDYDNFIEPFQVVGFDPLNNLIIFQSVNLNAVEIRGVEIRGQWAPERFPEGLYLRFAGSWSEGDNLQNDQPLNSIAPPNGVLGLEYAPAQGRWGASLIASGATRQDRLDESDGPVLSPEGYLVFDATAWWKPTKNTRLRAGLFNLLDENYTAYLDVAGVPSDTPDLERFQRPGINFSLAFDWSFQ